MAAITPSTNLYLIKNTNNLSKQNQLTFANETAQTTYFTGITDKLFVENFTYQRKDYTIRYPECIDNIINYNYVMYQNEAYGSKWFYAYITNMRWVNDHMTEITIETDVYQTFMFDITFKASFVEREHVNNDTVGLHTIPEGLETGEYICSTKDALYSSNRFYICIAVSDLTDEVATGVNTDIRQFGGVYSGLNYLVCETPLAASKTIKAWDAAGKGDAVTSVFMIPANLAGSITFNTYTTEGVTYNLGLPTYTDSFQLLATSVNYTSPSTIDGYTPKNNKLFCHPYNYFYISNNVGSDIDFHYEDFINNTASFKTIGTLTPGCSIKCVPLNYKKLQDYTYSASYTLRSFNYGISVAKLPICSWSSDVYTNWLTQNGINIGGIKLNAAEAGYVGGVVTAGIGLGSLLAGNAFGIAQVGAGIGDILGTMKENYQHSLIPDAARGNANSGDITYSTLGLEVSLYKMNIRSEYAKAIDGYFNMFGYKVNSLKVPNLTGRTYWNYVKTIGANIEGGIPEFYMDELKSMFNAGITLWHDPTKFLDYSQTNSIVS